MASNNGNKSHARKHCSICESNGESVHRVNSHNKDACWSTNGGPPQRGGNNRRNDGGNRYNNNRNSSRNNRDSYRSDSRDRGRPRRGRKKKSYRDYNDSDSNGSESDNGGDYDDFVDSRGIDDSHINARKKKAFAKQFAKLHGLAGKCKTPLRKTLYKVFQKEVETADKKAEREEERAEMKKTARMAAMMRDIVQPQSRRRNSRSSPVSIGNSSDDDSSSPEIVAMRKQKKKKKKVVRALRSLRKGAKRSLNRAASAAATRSTSRSPAKKKNNLDDTAEIDLACKKAAEAQAMKATRALKYEMAKDALMEALTYDCDDRKGQLKKTVVVAKAKKFCIAGASMATTQTQLFKIVENIAEKMADGQSFFQDLKKEKRKLSNTVIKKTISQFLNAIAFFFSCISEQNKKREWKKWHKWHILQSQLTKYFLLVSHKKCHSHIQALLRKSEDEKWIKFRQKDDDFVYIVANILTGLSYIGRTNNRARRAQEHLSKIYKRAKYLNKNNIEPKITKGDKKDDSTEKFYRVASAIHPYHWTMIPLAIVHRKCVKALERKLIKGNPKCSILNTQFKRKSTHRPSQRQIISLRKASKKGSIQNLLTTTKSVPNPKFSDNRKYSTNTTVFIHDKLATPFLGSIFQKTLRDYEHSKIRHKPVKIEITPGIHDFSNYVSLRRRFGLSMITIYTPHQVRTGLLKNNLKLLKIADSITIEKISTLEKVEKRNLAKQFQKILTSKLKKLWPLTLHDLVYLYFKSSMLMEREKKNIRAKLRFVMKKKYGVPTLANMVVKLPQNSYNRKTIYLLLRKIIMEDTANPKFIKLYLLSNIRIVLTKRKSMLDIFDNNIKITKELTETCPECTCKDIQKITGIKKPKDQHICIQNANIALFPELQANLKNTLHPEHIDAKKEVTAALIWFYKKTVKSFYEPHQMGIDHSADICDSVTNLCKSQNLSSEGKIDTRGNSLPTIEQFEKLVEKIKEAAVCTYQDKNGGAGIIMCKKHHWELNKKSFLEDSDHYEIINKSNETILTSMEDFHTKMKLDKIREFNKEKALPYSYVLTKFKDITRIRPIVSYFHHPLKKIYNYASRSLAHVLKKSDTKHFTLWKTQDLRPTISSIEAELKTNFNDDTKIMAHCADIKNMYTELPHKEILKAVRFFLTECSKKTRRKHVTIGIYKDGGIHLGRSKNTDQVCLSFEEIYKICEFDINNCFFTSLGKILRQIRGVPMGSPASPNLAIAICAFYENNFNEKLSNHNYKNKFYDCTPIVRAIRYIDDLLVFLAYDRKKPESKEICKNIIQEIQNTTYNESMKLKPEDTSKGFPYLESVLEVVSHKNKNDTIKIGYNDKNYEFFKEHGSLKILTLQHRDSFITQTQAEAKMIGQMHRINKTVNSGHELIQAVFKFITIAKHLRYKRQEIKMALLRMVAFSKHFPKIWAKIYNTYKLPKTWADIIIEETLQ